MPEGAAARPPRRRPAPGDGRSSWPTSTATTTCPTTDVDDLADWFNRGAKRNDLVLYLETFAHTVGVMQHRDAHRAGRARVRRGPRRRRRRVRRGALAPELRTEAGPHARRGGARPMLDGFRPRLGRHRPDDLRHLLGHAHRGAQPGDRRAGRALPRRRRGRLRHRRRRGRLPADPPPRRVPVRAARELPHHDPRRRGVRPAVASGRRCSAAAPSASATACASSTTSPATPGDEQLGRLAAYVRDRRIPLELCPTSNVNTGVVRVDRRPPDRDAAPAAVPRHGEHRQPADERHVDDATSCVQLRDAFGWGLDDFEWLTINAMKSAFAPFPERLRIINGARSSRATRCSPPSSRSAPADDPTPARWRSLAGI